MAASHHSLIHSAVAEGPSSAQAGMVEGTAALGKRGSQGCQPNKPSISPREHILHTQNGVQPSTMDSASPAPFSKEEVTFGLLPGSIMLRQ